MPVDSIQITATAIGEHSADDLFNSVAADELAEAFAALRAKLIDRIVGEIEAGGDECLGRQLELINATK